MAATKVRLSLLVKDPEVTEWKGVSPVEGKDFEFDLPLLDGPVSDRVAVLDFDESGTLRPPARFVPPAAGRKLSRYDVAPPKNSGDPISEQFLQVSVFGTVYKTLEAFEEPDALGRRVTWAFNAPQLLVVPAAGEWANACYERESHSLQFFYFLGPNQRRIYTSHSQDIVSHETAHAIIDGVAPDLYHALSPQGLALHEALADVTALMMSLRSQKLAERVLENCNGVLDDPSRGSNAFTGIAEQFALARNMARGYLRDLRNHKILGRPGEGGRLLEGTGERVRRMEPHELSEVLSGALWDVMVRLFNQLKLQFATAAPDAAPPSTEQLESASGKALAVAAHRLKRFAIRGLDYLPPGEISFADYGRAMIAADAAAHPDDPDQRTWLAEIFVQRGIVENTEELETATLREHPAVAALDLDELVASDWRAYEFANSNRELLGIPPDVTFAVRPRLKVKRLLFHDPAKGEEQARARLAECLFKVSWTESEENAAAPELAKRRLLTLGTTLAIDWGTRKVRALLKGDPRGDELRAERDAFLRLLLASGAVTLGAEAEVAGGSRPIATVEARAVQGALRLRGTARALHVCSLDPAEEGNP